MTLSDRVLLALPADLRPKLEIVAEQHGLRPSALLRTVVIDYVLKEFERIQTRARRDERTTRLRAEFERREAKRRRDAERTEAYLASRTATPEPDVEW